MNAPHAGPKRKPRGVAGGVAVVPTSDMRDALADTAGSAAPSSTRRAARVGGMSPLLLGMVCVLLTFSALPFASLIFGKAATFVHDHPVAGFAQDTTQTGADGDASTATAMAAAPPLGAFTRSTGAEGEAVSIQSVPLLPIAGEGMAAGLSADNTPPSSATTGSSGTSSERIAAHTATDTPEAIVEPVSPSIFSSFLSTFKATQAREAAFGSPANSGLPGSDGKSIRDSSSRSNTGGPASAVQLAKAAAATRAARAQTVPEYTPATAACGGVHLFVAVREDSAAARALYRRTWLNPVNWAPIKKGPLAESLPPIAYRFFVVESESEPETTAQKGGKDAGSSTKSSSNWLATFSGSSGSKAEPVKDTVTVPKAAAVAAIGQKDGSNSRLAPTAVRSWAMAWTVKHTEFRFWLFLDLGYSSPRPTLRPLTSSSSSSPQPVDQSTGSGFAMVCLERIADELHFRPPERFLWATHDCQGGSLGDPVGDDGRAGAALWPQRPVFQLFSQDVVEMVLYAEGQLQHGATPSSSAEGAASKRSGGGSPTSRRGNRNSRGLLATTSTRDDDQSASSSGGALSANALLQALSLTILDDRLRIANARSPVSMTLHAREVFSEARKLGLKARLSSNATALGTSLQDLKAWTSAGGSGREANKASGTNGKPKKNQPEGVKDPVCKAMTMYYGLNSAESIEDLFYSNSNRSKTWKQYRDQIARLGPACDAAKKVDDIGLTTVKVAQKAKSPPPISSSSSGGNSNLNAVNTNIGEDDEASEGSAAAAIQAETRDRLALATRFLESEDLFTDAERFLILEKCGLVASCLWAEVTSGVVQRWWHVVDGTRASRCKRHDAHSKGSCDAFKSRAFLPSALVEGADSSSSSVAGKQPVMMNSDAPGRGYMKRKVEEGQKAVAKDRASGAALASFPGSGNTWSRMLLEYASGRYTGSIYNDITLMPVLPAEGVRTHEVIAWKAHVFPSQYVDNYRPAKVVLLVRHPIPALWSEFQRRLNVEAGSRGGGGHVAAVTKLTPTAQNSFKGWSKCMACRWLQYITAHLQLAQVMPLKILLFERLTVDPLNAMREVLEFLGVETVDEQRLACATTLADHPLVHRPPANFTVHDAFKAFPEHACVILRTIEQHDQGRLIMRLFGYGNSMKPPKECAEATGESFACVDMLTTEYHGAQACKLGSVSSGSRAAPKKVSNEKSSSLRQHSAKEQ